jgi:hypothetical protein
MVTNRYLNHTENYTEQNLVNDLIEEGIQIHGHDVFYVVRQSDTPDAIYKEDDTNTYKDHLTIEAYINNFNGYAGDGELFTKFGIEVRDELVITILRSRFKEEVDNNNLSLVRPREGDIIYFPIMKDYFIVKFVEHRDVFYQLGKLYTYQLRLSKFEYNSEKFETGIPEIDQINKYSNVTEEDKDPVEPAPNKPYDGDQSDDFKTGGDEFIDFSETNPFSERR